MTSIEQTLRRRIASGLTDTEDAKLLDEILAERDRLSAELERIQSDLFRMRDRQVDKAKREREKASELGIGGFAVNAAWAAARFEFADDLKDVIWPKQEQSDD